MRNKHGMSIMGVLVAAGLMSIIAVVLASLFRQTNQNTLVANQANEIDNLRSLAKAITRAHNDCGLPNSVIGTNINLGADGAMTNGPLPVAALGQNQIVPGNQFRSITLNGMEVANVVRPVGGLVDTGTARLRLMARKNVRSGAMQDVVEEIPLRVRFSDPAAANVSIVECMPDDGDVVTAVENHLNSSLDPRIRNYIDANIAQHMDTFIAEQINNDPSTLLRLVNNNVVQASVCGNLQGATWDSENEVCNLPSGPTPASPTPTTITDSFEQRFTLTGFGTNCQDAHQELSRRTKYNTGRFLNTWCDARCKTVQGVSGGNWTAAWSHGCINPVDRNSKGRKLADKPGVNIPCQCRRQTIVQ